jgi:hypothetical protein
LKMNAWFEWLIFLKKQNTKAKQWRQLHQEWKKKRSNSWSNPSKIDLKHRENHAFMNVLLTRWLSSLEILMSLPNQNNFMSRPWWNIFNFTFMEARKTTFY